MKSRLKFFPCKDMTPNAQLISESMQSPRCRQPHPSHAAEGVRWKGGRKVEVMRQEQLGVSSSGAKDLPQGLAVGYNREQRPGCACCGCSAGTGGAQDSKQRHTQRRQLRRVAQSFGGTAARRPKRGKPNHDRIRTQSDHQTRMAT